MSRPVESARVPRSVWRSARRAWGTALVGLVLLAAGCASSTDPASSTSEPPAPSAAPSTTAAEVLAEPALVADLPSDRTVTDAVLLDTTAWVLMSGPDGVNSIWRFTADGTGDIVVEPTELADLEIPSVAIAAWPHGVIVTGLRCDEPIAGECVSDSGIVRFLDDEGIVTEDLELWQAEPTQAGGSAPRFIGHDDDHAWFGTVDSYVAVDASGEISARVPRAEYVRACVIDGALYGIVMDTPPLPETITPETADELEPATVSVQRWDGSAWTSVADGDHTSSVSFPEATCQGAAIGLWADQTPEASWTPEQGWVDVPEPTDPAGDTGTFAQIVSGPSGGALYRLGDDFGVQRLDPATGETTDTGLALAPNADETDSFTWIAAAESGVTSFACVHHSNRLAGAPLEDGTVCGFAAVPS